MTHKHQGKGVLFSHFGKPYGIIRVVLIVVLPRYINLCRFFAFQPL